MSDWCEFLLHCENKLSVLQTGVLLPSVGASLSAMCRVVDRLQFSMLNVGNF